MAKKSDTIEKMLANPADDWTIKDVLKVAKQVGLFSRRASTGSHHTFTTPHMEDIVTIPEKRPIKAVYIRRFARMAVFHRRCEEKGE